MALTLNHLIANIAYDSDLKVACACDVIRIVCNKNAKAAAQIIRRILAHESDICKGVKDTIGPKILFKEHRKKQFACDAETMFRIIGILPGPFAKAFREANARLFCRFVSGDESLLSVMDAATKAMAGTELRAFLLHPSGGEDGVTQRLEWQKQRNAHRQNHKDMHDAFSRHPGFKMSSFDHKNLGAHASKAVLGVVSSVLLIFFQ